MKNQMLILSLLLSSLAVKASDKDVVDRSPLQQAMDPLLYGLEHRTDKAIGMVCCSCGAGITAGAVAVCLCGIPLSPTGSVTGPVCCLVGGGFCLYDRCTRSPEKGEKLLSLSRPKVEQSMPIKTWGYFKKGWSYVGANIDSPLIAAGFNRLGLSDFYAVIKENTQSGQPKDD